MESPADPTAAAAAPDAERAALLALLAPHWEPTVALAHLLAPERARDVLSETVRAAWRHRDQFDGSGAGVRAWLLAVVADESRRRPHRPSRTAGAQPPGPDPSADPELRRGLARLRPEQRLALVLRGYLDLPPDAVGEVLGCAPEVAAATVEQAETELARVLAVAGAGDDATTPVRTRVRADAERARAAVPAVALEPLLAPVASGKARRPRWIWVAVAVVVALGIAVPVVALTTRSSGPTTSTATRVVRVTDAGFTGAVLDPTNPKRLYVLVTERAGDAPCLLQDPTATVTGQSARAVTITVSGFREVPATAARGQRLTYACRATVYVQVTATLPAALAGRQVIDAASGRAQPVLDPRTVPTPGYLPSGYQAQPVTWEPAGATPPGATGSSAPSPSPSPSPAPSAAADGSSAPASWAAVRRYRDGSADLDVRVADPSLFEGANPVGTATVSGHPATITQAGGTLCVTWTATAARAVQVCSAPDTSALPSASAVADDLPDVAPLDRQQLLRVARSLP